MKIYRKQSEQLFPDRRLLSYPNLNKKYKNVHKIQAAKKLQNIKQMEPQQKYRLGKIRNINLLGGLNRKYRRLTSPSSSAAVHTI